MNPDIPATPSETDETNAVPNTRAGGQTPGTYDQFANRASTRAWNALRQATWRPTADVPINSAPTPDERYTSDEPRFSTIFGTDIAEFGKRDQLLQDHVR